MFTENANVRFNPASESVRFVRNWGHYPSPRLLPPWLVQLSPLAPFSLFSSITTISQANKLHFPSTLIFSGPQWAASPSLRSLSSFLPPPQSSISNQEESSQCFHNNITSLPLVLSISSTRGLAQQPTFCHLP